MAKQIHRSELGRAASVAKSDTRGRQRRSVLPFSEMNIPSHSDRIGIWCYTCARSSLLEARMNAQYLLDHSTLDPEFRTAVVYCTVIADARPFTKSRVRLRNTQTKPPTGSGDATWIRAFDTNVVPERFRHVHQEHLDMRNQALGHKDATAFQGYAPNKVLVRVGSDGFDLRTVSVCDILEGSLKPTIELCDILVKHCKTEGRQYVARCSFRVPPGAYLLHTDESPQEWLEKRA